MRVGGAVVGIVVALVATSAAAQTGTGTGTGSGATYVDPKDYLGAPEVSAAASPTEIQLGTRFVLIVTAAYDEGVTVNLPARLDLGPAFEERARTSKDSRRSDGKKVREWQIECLAWELGELDVPPVTVTFIRGGSAAAVATNAVPVKVVGSLGDMVDATQPRALAAPLALWRRTWIWVAVAGGVLVALGAGLIARRLLRRRRGITVYVPVVRASGIFRRPRLGATAEEALVRLEAIDTSGMLARDRRVAYAEMIEVMRAFLGRQLGGDTADLTTGELLAWLDEQSAEKLADARRREVARWLDGCEEGKFGSFDPSIEAGRAHLDAGRELVIAIAAPDAPVQEAAGA